MKINPISNQTSFQAVNQKYYQWAKKETNGCHRFSELFTQMEMDVCWKDLAPQDAIDTLEAIKKIMPPDWKGIELTFDYIKKFLP